MKPVILDSSLIEFFTRFFLLLDILALTAYNKLDIVCDDIMTCERFET